LAEQSLSGWTEAPLTSLDRYPAWTDDADGVVHLSNKNTMTPLEATKATANRLKEAEAYTLYCVTRKALEDLDCDIRSVPMPDCPHGVFYDSLTDNYLVVRAPNDLSQMTVGKFLSTSLVVFRGVKIISIYFGTQGA